jgi:hypothetical protein
LRVCNSEEGALATEQERVVAIGLLTQSHIDMLGTSLKQVFPIAEDNPFDKLLKALDDLDGKERH